MSATSETVAAVPVGSRVASLSKWAPLPVVLAGVFMVVLDFFIVNVAMPTMQGELDAGANALQWVVAGYGLAFAAGLITGAGQLRAPSGRRPRWLMRYQRP